ncbi:MAG: CpsD/CapB family tyrosine-protein kinase [Phycisphaeraceae bacterium]
MKLFRPDQSAAGPVADAQPPARPEVDDRIVMLCDPGCLAAEEYRAIRTTLLARASQSRHLVHTLTSATPQEGKTITSLNLGFSLAELRNRRTLVIEADLRLPTFDALLQFDEGPGLVQVLRKEAHLRDAVRQVGPSGLSVLAAGGRAGDQAVQLLSGQRMARLVRALRKRFDHVIIDTPPVLELADAGILGAISDEVLLAVRMNRTPRPLVEQAVRTLHAYQVELGGVIATDHEPLGHRYDYRYGYRYRYRYHPDRRRAG